MIPAPAGRGAAGDGKPRASGDDPAVVDMVDQTRK